MVKHARQSIWAEGEQNLLRLLEREARYLAAEQVADAALTGLAAQAGILGVRLWDDQHRVLASSPHVSTQALPPADAPSPAAGAPTLTRRGEVLVGAAQLPRLWGTPSHPKRGGWLVVEQNLAPTSTWHSFAAATPCSGCWLLAAGCWLLAAGCWLLAAPCLLAVFLWCYAEHFMARPATRVEDLDLPHGQRRRLWRLRRRLRNRGCSIGIFALTGSTPQHDCTIYWVTRTARCLKLGEGSTRPAMTRATLRAPARRNWPNHCQLRRANFPSGVCVCAHRPGIGG